MQLTGLKYGKQLMDIVDFPVAETLTENATKEQIEALIKKGGKVVVKPSFMGSAGKKGKAGLVKIVDNYADANQARKDLCFAEYKQGNTTHKANGCTFEEFAVHLQKQFKEGMTLENHGDWHIDHIKPCATATSAEELAALFHFTNLQPLWASENLSKGCKYHGNEQRT